MVYGNEILTPKMRRTCKILTFFKASALPLLIPEIPSRSFDSSTLVVHNLTSIVGVGILNVVVADTVEVFFVGRRLVACSEHLGEVVYNKSQSYALSTIISVRNEEYTICISCAPLNNSQIGHCLPIIRNIQFHSFGCITKYLDKCLMK